MKFSDISKKDSSRLLVVDALNLAFRYKHSGNTTNFSEDYVRTVRSLASSYGCGKVVIVADKGSSSFRKAIFPEYKQNRKDKYETQSEAEKQAFAEFFESYEDTLEVLNRQFSMLRFDGVEADDIAAYIVKKYKTDYKIWLVSSDKDWDILIGDSVSRFSYVTRKETTADNWHEHYDVTIDNYVGFKALMGDPGDNIKGVESVGPTRARDLLEKYGDIFSLLDNMPLAGKQKFIINLNNSAEVIERNLVLMDLLTYCEEAIGADNIKEIEKCLQT